MSATPRDLDLEKLRLGTTATVMYTGMKNYLRYSEVLNPEQMANFMQRYYEGMFDAMQLFGALSVQFEGGAVLAVYPADDGLSMSKEVRLWRAATAVRQASQRLKVSFDRRFERMGLPLFETSMALHTGVVQIIGVGTVDDGQKFPVPIGDTINVVREIFQKMQHRWDVTASVEVVQGLRQVAKIADRHVIHLPPRLGTLDVCELEEVASVLEGA